MKKKSETIGFKTTPQIRAALEDFAKKEDRSMSNIINHALMEYLKIKPDEQPKQAD